MNEGWASFWHKRILEALDLPQGLHLEFIVRHTQVLRPSPGRPQSLPCRHENLGGYREALEQSRAAEEKRSSARATKAGNEKLFEVREVERDARFCAAT